MTYEHYKTVPMINDFKYDNLTVEIVEKAIRESNCMEKMDKEVKPVMFTPDGKLLNTIEGILSYIDSVNNSNQ